MALEKRRVHEARRKTDFGVAVVDHHGLFDRNGVLRGGNPNRGVDALMILPVDRQPREAPARPAVCDLGFDGPATDERPVVFRQVEEHP